jgi:hypothetical protein
MSDAPRLQPSQPPSNRRRSSSSGSRRRRRRSNSSRRAAESYIASSTSDSRDIENRHRPRPLASRSRSYDRRRSRSNSRSHSPRAGLRRSIGRNRPRRTNLLVEDPQLRHDIISTWGPHALDVLPAGFVVTKFLGAGGSGTVYQVCSGQLCFAIKLFTSENGNNEAIYELEMTKLFAAAGIGAGVYRYNVFDRPDGHVGYALIMDRIDVMLEKYLEEPRSEEILANIMAGIKSLMQRMCAARLSHGDLHYGNLGLRQVFGPSGTLTYVPVLFDFGYSRPYSENTRCRDGYRGDFVQLGRTLHRDYQKDMADENMPIIFRMLRELHRELIPNRSILRRPNSFDRRWYQWLDPMRPTKVQIEQYINTHIPSFPMEWIKPLGTGTGSEFMQPELDLDEEKKEDDYVPYEEEYEDDHDYTYVPPVDEYDDESYDYSAEEDGGDDEGDSGSDGSSSDGSGSDDDDDDNDDDDDFLDIMN